MLHTSKDIRNPGLRTLPPGVERYFVKGGGLSIIEVSAEDKIEIIKQLKKGKKSLSKVSPPGGRQPLGA